MVVAYAIKSELQAFSGDIDGFDLTYKKIEISGFPNKWIFTFDHPVIKSEDNYIDISLKNITLTSNLTFTKFVLTSAKDMVLNFAEEDGIAAYDVSFSSNPEAVLKRKNSFFSKDILYGFVSFSIAENILEVESEGNIILKIDNKSLSLVRNVDAGTNSFAVEYDLNYAGVDELLGFSKLRLGAFSEIVFGEDAKEKKVFLTSFNSKRFDIVVDEEAELHLSGQLNFVRDEFPTGIFTLDLVRAQKLVDLLWWSSFDLSADDVKNMIVKASGNQLSDNITLPVVFSTDGLTVGASSWQQLKRGD